MRPFAAIVAALSFGAGALAVEAIKSATFMGFDASVTQDMVDAAKDYIVSQGGRITHDFHSLKGFSAIAPFSAVEYIREKYTQMTVEDDQIMTTNQA